MLLEVGDADGAEVEDDHHVEEFALVHCVGEDVLVGLGRFGEGLDEVVPHFLE